MKNLSITHNEIANMANGIVDQIPEWVSAATQYLSDLQNLNTVLMLYCILNVVCIALTTKDLLKQTNKFVKIAPFFILSIMHASCFCGYFFNQDSVIALTPYFVCLSVSVIATITIIELVIGIRKAIVNTFKFIKEMCVAIAKLTKLGIKKFKEFISEHKPAFKKALTSTIKFFKMVGLLVLALARRVKEKVKHCIPVVKSFIYKGLVYVINITKKAVRAITTFFKNIKNKRKTYMDDDDYMTMT